MSDENNRGDEINLNLDLSLGFPEEEGDLVPEEQGHLVPQEQGHVEEQNQGQFMQVLRSDPLQNIQLSPPPPPPPQHYTMNPINFANINVPTQALLPYPPPPSVLTAAPLPYQHSGRFLHPPQQNQVESVALEAPRMGRPPRGHQARRSSSRAGAVENDVPLYPWATKKATISHTVRDLCQKGITEISGQVYCKSCDRTQTLVYKLMEKFWELLRYIKANLEVMRQRAPGTWMTPTLTPCETCGSEMKPVISEKKEEINWLFLFLGQMLGCCTLEQLKFFCESISQHRTGSKTHVDNDHGAGTGEEAQDPMGTEAGSSSKQRRMPKRSEVNLQVKRILGAPSNVPPIVPPILPIVPFSDPPDGTYGHSTRTNPWSRVMSVFTISLE